MIRHLRYNIIMSFTMSMYKIDEVGFIIKFLYYFWRVVCNLGLTCGMVLSLAELFRKETFDIDEMAVGIMNTVIFLSSTIRINYFYFREDKLKNLVVQINEKFKAKSDTGFQEKTIDYYDRLTKILVVIWAFSVFFTGEFMALLPLLFIHKTGRVLPLPLWYPYDWKKSPYYEFTYFKQALIQYFMGYSYGNSDMFFACTALIVTSQFELLGWELKHLIYTTLLQEGVPKSIVLEFKDSLANSKPISHDILEVISGEKFKKNLKKNLNNCIEYHQVILKVCDEMQDFFSPFLLPAILFGISYAIFIMYSLVVAGSNSSVAMSLLEYICMTYAQIFCLTYTGQQLFNMSENLIYCLYEMPWYLCDNDFRKTLHIMQTKLLTPSLMTAWKFFDITLATFFFAIKTSFSYLAFLRQVAEK